MENPCVGFFTPWVALLERVCSGALLSLRRSYCGSSDVGSYCTVLTVVFGVSGDTHFLFCSRAACIVMLCFILLGNGIYGCVGGRAFPGAVGQFGFMTLC